MRHALRVEPLHPSTAGRRLALGALVALALLALVVNARAEGTVQVRGLIDIVAGDDTPYRNYNTLNTNDTNFDALRTRLFVEGNRGPTSVYLQFLVSPESYNTYRFFGGYLMHRPFSGRNVFIEAGLIPVHDGIWASHTYSNKNPLIGIPMSQYWKTSLTAFSVPMNLDQLLSMRGKGQSGVVYRDSSGVVRGKIYASSPILYDNCWNYGLYTLGTLGRVEFAGGVTLGSASASVQGADTNENLAVHGKIGYAFTPGLMFWLSATRGAYFDRSVTPYLPAGKTANNYFQNLWGVSGDWKVWKLWFMGEFWANHWDTPVRSNGLDNQAYYLQAVYSFLPGWDLCGRYDAMRFNTVTNGAGQDVTWDAPIDRWETGINYHVTRDLRIKGVGQFTRVDNGDWDLIPAIQASFAF
ncbi:MAG TPA: hypothetical protein VFH88_12575 [Candidatus Krumholzibacteria bacterium]|nr:hypothetical protein [Candidatus Krumholzibacteria bacterium]